MNDSNELPDEFAEKRISHDPIYFDGQDIYPNEWIELALSKAVPGEFAEKRIIHDIITFDSKDGHFETRPKPES